jgi:S1-C subfamily serine protease
MEHLNKQQIVLLALFTAFVASIATGIVTVSLVDQTNVGVTSTINRVVERTIERVITPSSTTTPITVVTQPTPKIVDPLADAVSNASNSIVKIKLKKEDGTTQITGLGLIVTKAGMVLTDKSLITQFGAYTAVLANGSEYQIQVIQAQPATDIAFVLMLVPDQSKKVVSFSPIQFPSSVSKLGQTTVALAGTGELGVSQGIVKKIKYDQASTTLLNSFETNIPTSETTVGGPLVDIFGNVIGMRTASISSGFEGNAAFYPTLLLKDSIPTL